MASKSRMRRILEIASKNESINSSSIRKAFKISGSDSTFDQNVLRIARFAVADGYLKRTEPGSYKITSKGTKRLAQMA